MNDDAPEGFLTGLIGEQGAIGAFVSGTGDKHNITGGTNADNGFAGGFVAAPPAACITAGNCVANHTAWLGSFGEETPPATKAETIARVHTFGGFLNLGSDVRAISEEGFAAGTVKKGILTLDGTQTNGYRTDGTHGIIYLGGQTIVGTNNQAFVAVLPTTNLGAVLTTQPTAAWTGHYYNGDVGAVQAIAFTIDFGGKSIRASDTVTSPAVTTEFALHFNAMGVITGTVSDGTDTATARGLIGTVGLVGVFVDATTNNRGKRPGEAVLYGGFVADNPDN